MGSVEFDTAFRAATSAPALRRIAHNALVDLRFGRLLGGTYLRNRDASCSDYALLEIMFEDRLRSDDEWALRRALCVSFRSQLGVLGCVVGCPWGLPCSVEDNLSALTIEEDDARLLAEVEAVQLHGRVVADALEAPQVALGFPQHRGGGHAGSVEELLHILEAV